MGGAEQDAEISRLKAQVAELNEALETKTVETSIEISTIPEVTTSPAKPVETTPTITTPESTTTIIEETTNNETPTSYIIGNTTMYPTYFQDEFGDITGMFCICFDTYGTFSNSATLNSNLGLTMLVSSRRENDPNHIDISFEAYEYGFDWDADPAWSDTYYTIKIKTSEGKIFTYSGFQKKGSPRIEVKNTDEESLIALLKTDASLSFRIEEVNKYSVPTVYLFNLSNIDTIMTAVCETIVKSEKGNMSDSISLTPEY